jgi:hypothetical protein
MPLISSRPAIAIAVTLATLIVCLFGIRAELKAANYSVLDHFFRSSPRENAAPALVAVGDKRGTDSAPP